jgi:hypothetical protein
MTLTDEVGYGLESLFLTHHEAGTLLFTVAHQLRVADATLLPLFVPPSEELNSDLHEALQVLLSSCRGDSGQVNLLT